MERRAGVSVSSRLDAPPGRIWEAALTAEGVNYELGPWMRMTLPRGMTDFDLGAVELGRPIGRSWVLFLGVIPIDFDEINLVELDPGSRFVERSRMLSQRYWEHRRSVEPDGDGCVVTDSITWEPRLPVPGSWLRPMFTAIFRHRHRRLRRRYGGRPASG